jgi:TonB family protein
MSPRCPNLLKLVLIVTLVGTTSFVARGDSGDATGCLQLGTWDGNMVFDDHVEAIHLKLSLRSADEYFTLGDHRYPLPAGVYGVVQFGEDHTSFSIEKPILACNKLTFEVHNESNVLVKFRLNITTPRVGGIARGEAEFPDRVAHVDWLGWPCGGSAPILMRKEDPKYTDEARRAQLQGDVMLRVQINPYGRASSARVVQGLGLGLDENAIEVVKHWEFRFSGPPPPACEAEVRVQFRIP